jgi:hypothetical protein
MDKNALSQKRRPRCTEKFRNYFGFLSIRNALAGVTRLLFPRRVSVFPSL